MIRLDNVSLAPGGNTLLDAATCHIRPGDRIGLVGRNGTGKTSLLRVIIGELDPSDGRVVQRSKLKIGYLPQQAVSGSQQSVWDEARSQMHHLQQLRSRLLAAQRSAEAKEPGSIEALDEAMERFRHGGGYTEEEQIGTVLSGLGFSSKDWSRSCDTFSGGWQMRIALARLLLSEPDIALLDEPTNHLDILARGWLAGFLANSRFATVIVSHDRHLLDRVATRVFELRSHTLHQYTGNFTRFLAERALRVEQQLAATKKQSAEVAKLERFVERFGAKASKAAQARSKQKKLDKMNILTAPQHHRLPRFSLPPAPAGDMAAIKLVDVTAGWPDGPDILCNINLTVERGRRIAVLGPNGCGKSTLLAVLSGMLSPNQGRRRVGDRIRIGSFTQDLAAELPGELTALEYVCQTSPIATEEQVRTTLGALGLSGEAALRSIKELSGGEKARVALASLTTRPNNVLLLDEPTNHLDTETVEVLVRALETYEGAMAFVTHDRYLVEQIATHVVNITGQVLDLHEGILPGDLEPKSTRQSGGKAVASGSKAHADRKREQRLRDRTVRRINEIEDEISCLETEISDLDAQLATSGVDYALLGTQRKQKATLIDELMNEWELLESSLNQ